MRTRLFATPRVVARGRNSMMITPQDKDKAKVMDANQFLSSGGRFIKREDLGPDGEKAFTIQDTDTAEFNDNGKIKRKLQIVVDEGARFSLNSTNLRLLIKNFTPDTNTWKNKSVILWWDEGVMFSGRSVGGIRIRVPRLRDEVGF
jgi:hypothetical protein